LLELKQALGCQSSAPFLHQSIGNAHQPLRWLLLCAAP
jgi:hypothetical protein